METIMKFFSSLTRHSSQEEPWIPTARALNIHQVYSFERILGQGSFGTVRECQHRSTLQRFACKSMRKAAPEGYSKEDQRLWKRTIQREVQNLQALQTHMHCDENQSRSLTRTTHPNLISFIDVYEDETYLHLIFEPCRGGELYDQVLEWKRQKQQNRERESETAADETNEQPHEEASSTSSTGDASNEQEPQTASSTPSSHELEAAKIIYQILDGISYLHEVHSMVHRDLKASNFLFLEPATEDSERTVQIIDFGLSKYVPHSSLHPTVHGGRRSRRLTDRTNATTDSEIFKSINSKTTSTGRSIATDDPAQNDTQDNDSQHSSQSDSSSLIDQVLHGRRWYGRTTSEVGTPYYVAPEVLTDKDYTCLCDVWSIGVISYLLLSRGKLPFQGKDERATIQLLLQDDLPVQFPTTGDNDWTDVSQAAQDFCRRLLQKDPNHRPTAREAMHDPWLLQHCGLPLPDDLPNRQLHANLLDGTQAKDSHPSSPASSTSSVSTTSWWSKLVTSSRRNE